LALHATLPYADDVASPCFALLSLRPGAQLALVEPHQY